MNKVRREMVDKEDKIVVVSFLNSQFEKAIVQFLRGDIKMDNIKLEG